MSIDGVGSVSQSGLTGSGDAAQGDSYTVQRGDTLSEIARDHGVSLDSVIQANPQIANPNLIYPDQVIHLPQGANAGGDGNAGATAEVTATAAPYTGGKLDQVQLAQVFHQAGFRGENLVAMVAISMRESGGNPAAFNGNEATRDLSYGLTQINMRGNLGPARREQLGLSSNEQLFDPLTNARAAFALSNNGTDLTPWGGYKGLSNTYNTDMGAARAAVAQADAQGLLGQPFDSQAPAEAPAARAASPAAAMPTLRHGSSGEAVSTLQTQLRDAGFNPGPIDGQFGPKTQAAVRQFQSAQGITVDGIVGPQTWGKLLQGAGSTPRLEGGAEGPAVADLQGKLKAAGVDPGPVDGQFGPRTESAVRQYQSSRGLTVDGIVGPQTWGSLNSGAGPVERPNPGNPTPVNPGEVARVSDAVSNQRIASLHPEVQAQAAAFVNQVEAELGITLRVTSGFRSFAEQDALYEQGRSTPGDRVTNARGGQSYHNYGLALDVVEVRANGSVNWNTDWAAIGRIGERMGFEWGGNWNGFVDRPHFQMDFGLSTGQLLSRVNNGQTTGGFVNVR